MEKYNNDFLNKEEIDKFIKKEINENPNGMFSIIYNHYKKELISNFKKIKHLNKSTIYGIQHMDRLNIDSYCDFLNQILSTIEDTSIIDYIYQHVNKINIDYNIRKKILLDKYEIGSGDRHKNNISDNEFFMSSSTMKQIRRLFYILNDLVYIYDKKSDKLLLTIPVNIASHQIINNVNIIDEKEVVYLHEDYIL